MRRSLPRWSPLFDGHVVVQPGHVQGSLASRLASDVFDSNGLWFHAYKRARRLDDVRG